MRLNKNQKEILLQWIAEGIKPGEMNRRAAGEAEPFTVTRQQVEYYRRQCTVDIEAITKQDEFKALNTGLALRSVRVEKLKQLAELMEKDLFGQLLWVDRLKSVGGGPNFMTFTEEEFNKAEVDAYSRILDDIAKELGHRVHKTELSTDPSGEIHVTFPNPMPPVTSEDKYPYFWRVKTRLPERKGQPCRVLVRSKMNSCLVEFEDGFQVVTSRNYLRKHVQACKR